MCNPDWQFQQALNTKLSAMVIEHIEIKHINIHKIVSMNRESLLHCPNGQLVQFCYIAC